MDPPTRPSAPYEEPPGATALVVLVPAAEPVVGALRTAHDAAAADGMPAHVTVLYPFMPEDEWRYGPRDERADVRLARLFRGIEPFDATFGETARFGDATLYLVPDPAGPFSELTDAVAAEFPAWPPYGGAYAVVVPHLTVADGTTRDVLDRCESAVAAGLPVTMRVEDVGLFARRAGRWTLLHRFSLGTGGGPVLVLRGDGQDALRLTVAGYEFGVSDPDSADWLVVRVRAASQDGASDVEGAVLESPDLLRLADFFDAAAAGRRDALSCSFTEPNLAFVRGADTPGAAGAAASGASVRLRVGFAPEWMLPWRPPTDSHPHPRYAMACSWIDLDLRPDTLRAAAATAREIAALWPSRRHLFVRPAKPPKFRRPQRRRRGGS